MLNAENISRAIGTVISAGLISLLIRSLQADLLSIQAPLFLITCPAVAAVFSLPRIPLSLYSFLGMAAALAMGVTAAIHWARTDDELGTEVALVGGFIVAGASALAGLMLGVCLRVLLQPRWK
jgi:hypothetical protein